jgi:RNA polymerase sigma-70 factor (ECF subfamily)
MKSAVNLFAVALTLLACPVVSAQEQKYTVASFPPVVVKTEPQSGDARVDASTAEIRVTFSRRMMDKSWSWSTATDQTNPETTGAPRYLADGKTCVLPVKLEPGRTYAFWINSQNFGNFKDRQGRAAVPYLLVFQTKKGN